MTQKELQEKEEAAGVILCKYGIVAIRAELEHACDAEKLAGDFEGMYHGDILVVPISQFEYKSYSANTHTHYTMLLDLFEAFSKLGVSSIQIM